MGRARGRMGSVTATVVGGRRNTSSLFAATERLRALLKDAKAQNQIRKADEFAYRRLTLMFDWRLPDYWAYDTALADAAPTLRGNSRLESALRQYLRARLERDL